MSSAAAAIDLLLPGRVAPAANAQSTIGAPLDGTVVEMHVAAGSIVKRGSPVASIRSPDGAAARAELDAARAALEQAEASDRRDNSLFDRALVSRQRWEATRAATLKAQADLRAAEGGAGGDGLAELDRHRRRAKPDRGRRDAHLDRAGRRARRRRRDRRHCGCEPDGAGVRCAARQRRATLPSVRISKAAALQAR